MIEFLEVDLGRGFEKISVGYFKHWHPDLIESLIMENKIKLINKDK